MIKRIPIIDINTGKTIRAFERNKAMPSWAVVVRPTEEQMHDIKHHLEMHNTQDLSLTLEVLKQIIEVYYVRAPTAEEAEKEIVGVYTPPENMREDPSNGFVIDVYRLKNNPYRSKVHIAEFQEKIKWIR